MRRAERRKDRRQGRAATQRRSFPWFSLLVVGVGALLVVHIFWLQLLDAVYLAFVFTQMGLLAHEAGHRQMFHHAWQHDLVTLVGGNFLLGMSSAWKTYSCLWLER